jgi:hypothetical protein
MHYGLSTQTKRIKARASQIAKKAIEEKEKELKE